jgi:hypothetical protein
MDSLGSSLAFAPGQWRPVGKHYARLAYSGRATSRSRQPPSTDDPAHRRIMVGGGLEADMPVSDCPQPLAPNSAPQLRGLNSAEMRSATRRAASSHSDAGTSANARKSTSRAVLAANRAPRSPEPWLAFYGLIGPTRPLLDVAMRSFAACHCSPHCFKTSRWVLVSDDTSKPREASGRGCRLLACTLGGRLLGRSFHASLTTKAE